MAKQDTRLISGWYFHRPVRTKTDRIELVFVSCGFNLVQRNLRLPLLVVASSIPNLLQTESTLKVRAYG